MKLLENIYNFLVIGPSGTGKTTFLCSYAEQHHKTHKSTGYWLTFPSIQTKLDELLPEWIKTTTDLLDPGFAAADEFPARKFVLGDEINRLISKYDHAKAEGKSFVDLVAIHRHKSFDLLVSDQVFDFLKGVRNRAHWIIFTGLNDTIYFALKDNLSPRLMGWVDRNQAQLVALGEQNRLGIPKGRGTVYITNGIHAFALNFVRPKWYTQELSTVWRMVSPEDLRKENEEDSTQKFDFESDYYRALCLALHISRKLFTGKITKEKIAAAYVPASVVIYGDAKKLSDNGRGVPELIQSSHALACYWCSNKEEYKEILKKFQEMAIEESEEDPIISSLEDKMAKILGG